MPPNLTPEPEPLDREADVLRTVLDQLKPLFPTDWRIEVTEQPAQSGGRRPDAILRIASPDGNEAVILVEAKLGLEPRDVRYVLQQLETYRDDLTSPGERAPEMLLVTKYISPRARELVETVGASYADATGNLRLRVDQPAVFIATQGASANPWREERATKTLRGRPAARIVRALCDFQGPLTALELSQRARTSIGSTYRMLDFLEREALIRREGKGLVVQADWKGLIKRWTQDYGLQTRNVATAFIAPRGIEDALDRLRGASFTYAVTASLAAAAVAPVAEPRLAALFADEVDVAADELSLSPASVGANVLLVEPFDEVVYERKRTRNGITYCGLSQVAADLLTSPGRGPSEAEELLRWMELNEPEWRI
jgi:hypothetical protein